MSHGFTLLEVVVALLLLQLAVVAALGTLAVASRNLSEAEQLERVVTRSEGVLDSLAGAESAESGEMVIRGGVIVWTVEASGVVLLRARRDDGRRWLDLTSALPAR